MSEKFVFWKTMDGTHKLTFVILILVAISFPVFLFALMNPKLPIFSRASNPVTPPTVDYCDEIPGNLLKNYNFESGKSNWNFQKTSDGKFTSADDTYSCAKVARVVMAKNAKAQLSQNKLVLKPDTAYELEFSAKSSTPREVQVFVHQHRKPYTNYGLDYRASLTTEWQTFKTNFTTPSVLDDNSRIRFWFSGRKGDNYWIDNVILKEAPIDSDVTGWAECNGWDPNMTDYNPQYDKLVCRSKVLDRARGEDGGTDFYNLGLPLPPSGSKTDTSGPDQAWYNWGSWDPQSRSFLSVGAQCGMGPSVCLGNSFTPTPTPSPTSTPSPTPTASKRVFVTSTTYNGNLGGLSGADAKCQERADIANLGGTWKAWLSDSSNSVNDRFVKYQIPYLKIDGDKIADSWSDLIDGDTLDSAIDKDEYGISPNGLYQDVWTGTWRDGSSLKYSGNCSNWTATLEGQTGSYGRFQYNNPNGNWTGYGDKYCNLSGQLPESRLYCFEQ